MPFLPCFLCLFWFCLQILHGELEESLQNSRQQLEILTLDLEKQKQLNENLENDLLSINKENGHGVADAEVDILTKLDTGKRTVSVY